MVRASLGAKVLRRAVGKVPAEQALERGVTRYGRGVRSQSLDREAKRSKESTQIIEEELKKIETQAAEWSRRETPPKNLIKLLHQGRILNILRQVGERPIHVSELVAALCFEHGLEKEKIKPYLNALTARSIKKHKLYEGSPFVITDIFNKDLPFKIEQLLYDKSVPMTSDEIATQLGYNLSKMNKKEQLLLISRIDRSLGILDLMGLTKKLPHRERKYPYIHSVYRLNKTTLPEWNVGWKILQSLREGPKILSDMAIGKIQMPGKIAFRFRGTIAGEKMVRYWGNNLIRSGLLTTRKKGKSFLYELTDEGRRLLQKQDKYSYLIPELRKLLLGSYSEGLLPSEERMYGRLVRWVNGMQKDKNKPRKRPHFSLSIKTLEEKYLPLMHEKHPEEAEWFAKWIEQKKKKH